VQAEQQQAGGLLLAPAAPGQEALVDLREQAVPAVSREAMRTWCSSFFDRRSR
jgi:hypothetical protein